MVDPPDGRIPPQTAEAQKAEDWTQATIEERTEQLIAILLKPWHLAG